MLCAVCTVHVEMRSTSFMVEPQNQSRWFVSGLASDILSGLASKPIATVSPSLALKLVVGFWVEPQNKGGGGFPGLGLKTGSNSLMIYALKSPRQFLGLRLKTKQAMVCRSCYKTDGRVTVWNTRRDLAT
jgi:hypothetical protein